MLSELSKRDLKYFSKNILGLKNRLATQKDIRRYISQLPREEKRKFIKNFANPNLIAPKSTVALNTDIKPEWVVCSSKYKEYSFEDQLRKDPLDKLMI